MANYEQWISRFEGNELRGRFEDDHKIEVVLTVIDGDDLESNTSAIPFCGTITTVSVSGNGTISSQCVTLSAVQGGLGEPTPLPAEDWKRMQPLIAHLSTHPPEDFSRLPPPGRRAVLQVRQDGKIVARVYDRADLPESISEFIGLTGATHGPMTMDFAPTAIRRQTEINEQSLPPDAIGIRRPHPRDPVTNGLSADTLTLAVSPDHSLVVTRYLWQNDRTEIADVNRSIVVDTVPNSFLNRRSIDISHAYFSPDGRFLLLLSNLPAMYIYNTQTWQKVTALPGLPSGGVAYYPSEDWKYGVVVSPMGEVSLWDATAARKLNTLDVDDELKSVSFSPDGSLLAITSFRQSKEQGSTFHLRIWETKTGHFVRELRPLYYFEHDVMGDPMWWGDGGYLLAESREGRYGNYVIGVWNVTSGKFRGGFSGCGLSDDAFDVALSGERLFQWCGHDKLLTWDVTPAIDQVASFESSLERTHDALPVKKTAVSKK